MAANWESEAATAAGADLGRMGTALSASSTHLGTAARAVDTYQADLLKIRSSVDDLRAALNKQQAELSAEQTQYARAGRFGEVNDMDPTQVASYRSGITSDEALTQRRIRHLHDEYAALVRRANTATATCGEALTLSIHGAQYNGSTFSTVGLGPALGLGNLTMLAAWEIAVEKHPPAFPKGKTPAETARLVAAYWACPYPRKCATRSSTTTRRRSATSTGFPSRPAQRPTRSAPPPTRPGWKRSCGDWGTRPASSTRLATTTRSS